jgi:hypothetical protein
MEQTSETIDDKFSDMKEICAGCDEKDYTAPWVNDKNYCNRCLTEIKALYEQAGERK